MAQATAEKTQTPQFSIKKHIEQPKVGKYDAEVAALVEADTRDGNVGANSIEILVPTKEVSDRGRYAGQEVDAVPKYIRYFQYSAKQAGYTARVESQIEQGDGSTVVSFFLAPLIVRGGTGEDTPLDVPEEF